jgi:hypothetical protein
MIVLDLSILNQKGTPMFNSDLTANRPAAGIVGRIFIATDSPYGIFRDTGSAWDSIAGGSTFSGSLATGQVAFGSAANTISGTNNLFYNNANTSLLIGTDTIANAFGHKIRAVGLGDASIAIFRNQASSSPAKLEFFRSRGTYLAPTASSANDQLMNIAAFGWGSAATQYTNAAAISIIAESIGATAIQGKLNITTYNNTGGNFVNASFKNSFSAPGSGGCSVISSSVADGIVPLGTFHVRGFDNTSANNAFYLENSTQTQLAKLSNDGQLLIGIGAFTGQRFQVNGDSFMRGTGSTSATNALLIQNSLNIELLRLDNSGQLIIQNRVNTSRLQTFAAGSGLEIVGGVGSAPGGVGMILGQFTNVINTSGTYDRVQTGGAFLPTSGTGIFNCFNVGANINQTGGSNGITRGVYIVPTLTAAADWRSLQWDNNTGWGIYGNGTALSYFGGSVGIKTTAPYVPSTFSLDVNGGLLVKNTAGTTAQITLINADPSTGGNNGFLVQTVGGTSGGSYVDFQGYYGTSIVGSTALRLNPAGGPVIVNSTTNTGEQFQLTGTLRINGQSSGTAGGSSGQHLIINLDGTTYKIALLNP